MKDKPGRGHHRQNNRKITVKRDKIGRPFKGPRRLSPAELRKE
jgi:hypothetical protein